MAIGHTEGDTITGQPPGLTTVRGCPVLAGLDPPSRRCCWYQCLKGGRPRTVCPETLVGCPTRNVLSTCSEANVEVTAL